MNIIWQPRESLFERLKQLSITREQPTEEIISEAVSLYLDTQAERRTDTEYDSLIGLFAGWPSLAIQSEQVLREEISVL